MPALATNMNKLIVLLILLISGILLAYSYQHIKQLQQQAEHSFDQNSDLLQQQWQTKNQQGYSSDVLLAAQHHSPSVKLSAALYQAVYSNRELLRYQGHAGTPILATLSADGQLVASADSGGEIHVWHLESGQQAQHLSTQGYALSQLYFASNQLLFGLDNQGNIYRWSLAMDETQKNSAQAFILSSPAKQLYLSPDKQYLLSSHADKVARLWSLTGELLSEFGNANMDLQYLDFSPNNQKILSWGAADNSIRVWQITALSKKTKEVTLEVRLKGHSQLVHDAKFSADSETILSASADQTVRIWNLFNGSEKMLLKGHRSGVNAVHMSPDGGSVMAVCDNAVWLWSTQGQLKRLIPTGQTRLKTALFNKADQQVIGLNEAGIIQIWRSQDGRLLATLGSMTTGKQHAVMLHPKINQILSISQNAIHVWDGQSQQQSYFKTDNSRLNQIAIHPQGEYVASAGDNQQIWIHDIDSGKVTHRLHGHNSPIYSLVFSQDGHWLLSGSQMNTLRLWDWQQQQTVALLNGHGGAVVQLQVRADNKQVLSRSLDNSIRLWSLPDAVEQAVIYPHFGTLNDSAYRADGQQLYSIQTDHPTNQYAIMLWSLDGELQHQLNSPVPIYAVAYHPNNQFISAGEQAGNWLQWDLSELGVNQQATPNQSAFRQIKAHQTAILALQYSPDGRYLATAGMDQTIKLWDSEQAILLQRFDPQQGWIKHLLFSETGDYLLSDASKGNSQLWSITGDLLATLPHSHTSAQQILFSSKQDSVFVLGQREIQAWQIYPQPEQLWQQAKRQLPKIIGFK